MTRVLRVYHAGRDPGHRSRERALHRCGVDLTLAVPSAWPDAGAEPRLSPEAFPVFELRVRRSGDVNRHRYRNTAALRALVRLVEPDVIDIHEEPFSVAARQWLAAAGDVPVVMYSAQNLDKRFPPPFAWYERQALRRVQAMYPCSRQAASVVRGKGFGGRIEVLPLGFDPAVQTSGEQSAHDGVVVLGLVGRLVAEKGVQDAVRVLAAVRTERPARLVLAGTGPELEPALRLAERFGVRDDIEVRPWLSAEQLAEQYRRMHVVLVPSTATATWVEQFGRVAIEAQAAGAVVAGYSSGALPEVAGPHAVLRDQGDVTGLAGAVRSVLAHPDDWRSRRTAGLAWAASHTWDEVARRQMDLYASVAAGERTVIQLPRSPQEVRHVAREEFGAVAVTPISSRPVALPVVRQSAVLDRGVGRSIDLLAARPGRDGRGLVARQSS